MSNMVINPRDLGSLDANYNMGNMVVNPWDLGSLDARYNMSNMVVNPWDLGLLDASYNMGNMAVNPWDLGSLDASYNISNMVVNPWDLLSIRYLVSKLTLSNEHKRRFLFSLSCSAHKQQQHIMHGNCLKGPSRIVEPEPRASDLSANAAQRFAGKISAGSRCTSYGRQGPSTHAKLTHNESPWQHFVCSHPQSHN
jgi:uncharacterized phage-associated protein